MDIVVFGSSNHDRPNHSTSENTTKILSGRLLRCPSVRIPHGSQCSRDNSRLSLRNDPSISPGCSSQSIDSTANSCC